MRVAAIDIGTNSIVFLVADAAPGRGLVAVHDVCEIARLGEGVDRTKELQPAAIERALGVLAACVRRARELGAERIGAVGTQALREVRNGHAFLGPARDLLGVDVEVIDGEREARLSWRSALTAFPFPATPGGRRTVLDIGGGSTELLVGPAPGATSEPERLVSVAIGSVRLTERLVRHDPPTPEERAALVATIDEALGQAPAPEGELIGIAGTVTTLCAIHLGLRELDGARVHGVRLGREDVDRVVERLGRLSVAERCQLAGLDPRRADVIFAGGLILSRVLARAATAAVIVSDRGIRWGLAEELAARV
jgi:exopolyphosphatase/guanosine-5'-triphosphate,3'-diphosphate pyrophosphatase